MKSFKIALLLVVALLAGQAAFAQTTINSTTLSTAITDTGATTGIVVASIGSGATAVLAGQVLFIDGEAMTVRTTPTTTTVTVNRHTQATRGQTHASGAIVYYGNGQAFVSGTSGVQFYQGSCTASANLYLPLIDTVNGTVGNCLDSRWSWTRLSAPAAATYPLHPVVNAAYTAKLTDYFIGYTSLGAAYTITLPAPTGLAGKVYIIKNLSAIGTNTIWVYGNTTINGSGGSIAVYGVSGTTVTTGTLKVVSSGSDWFAF